MGEIKNLVLEISGDDVKSPKMRLSGAVKKKCQNVPAC